MVVEIIVGILVVGAIAAVGAVLVNKIKKQREEEKNEGK